MCKCACFSSSRFFIVNLVFYRVHQQSFCVDVNSKTGIKFYLKIVVHDQLKYSHQKLQ